MLVLGGKVGAGGDLADVEADRSQPNGPLRGGNDGGGAWIGGVDTPDEAEETEPRFREGRSGGTGVWPPSPDDVASAPSEDRRDRVWWAVSSNDTSVRDSLPSAASSC